MRITLIFMLLATLLSGCTKPKSEKADNTTLIGSVLLFDEGRVMLDKSGMTVSVENSNPLISAVTNSTGDFTLLIPKSLNEFALVYTKPLYGTRKHYYRQTADSFYTYSDDLSTIIAGEPYAGESLGYKSTVTVNSLTTSIVNGKLRITCNISSPNINGEKFIRFFYQKNLPNISFATVDKTYKNMGMPYAVNNGDNVIDVCMSCLYQCADMKSGETIYITAYGDSFYSNLYTDKPSNYYMMPNINLSNNPSPVSFVLP